MDWKGVGIDSSRLVSWLCAWNLSHEYAALDVEFGQEAGHSIRLHTVDGGSWRFEVYLSMTELEGVPFEGDARGALGKEWWYRAWVDDDRFRAQCSTFDLPVVLRVFNLWAWRVARGHADRLSEVNTFRIAEFDGALDADGWPVLPALAHATDDLQLTDNLSWLQRWYARWGDGQSRPRISLSEYENPGWKFEIDIADTDLAGAVLHIEPAEHDEDDWIQGGTDREDVVWFACGLPNLAQAIHMFAHWARSNGSLVT